MPGVYKVTEIVGTSPVSFTEAVKAGVAEAAKTVRGMNWLEVSELRGRIAEGKVEEFQVTLKIGFKLER
jgi:flavin-binding protein dodecin